ncbi:MAG TPA: M15 family metallopeptidase [Kamptonema sp.]|nr:M15 family metallopeptidase [Kamptonema sp.]
MKLGRIGKYLIVFLLVLLSVSGLNLLRVRAVAPSKTIAVQASPSAKPSESIPLYQLPSWARMIDIRTVNPNIRLDIRYATTNNFLKRKLYPVARCILRASVAQRLSRVQENIEKMGLGLKVYDCYRPLSVTKQMWAAMPDSRYVANPANGSRHNRGAAVDLTLVDRNGKELEMPTGFDNFTEKAYRDYEGGSYQSRKNSQLLEKVMAAQGFVSLSTEWWHFDAEDWEKFSLLDIPLQAIP